MSLTASHRQDPAPSRFLAPLPASFQPFLPKPFSLARVLPLPPPFVKAPDTGGGASEQKTPLAELQARCRAYVAPIHRCQRRIVALKLLSDPATDKARPPRPPAAGVLRRARGPSTRTRMGVRVGGRSVCVRARGEGGARVCEGAYMFVCVSVHTCLCV